MSNGTSKEATLRRFLIIRDEDVSGTSGTGVVAEGIEWSNGWVDVHWLSQLASKDFCENLSTWMKIHGHGGKTRVEWLDK